MSLTSATAAMEPLPEGAAALVPEPLPEGVAGLVPEPLPLGDPNVQVWAPEPEPTRTAGLPAHVKSHVLSGTSALGASVALERGAGFLANILALRLGGAQTFGAYSLAVSTATQISTYAASNIGATAARFSGKYPRDSAGYPSLLRALSIVSVASAVIASLGLWFGAGPIAHLLGKESLVTLLRCAWVSAAGVLLLECARGFLVGQRFVAALLSLSLSVGAGMVFLLPYAAHRHSPALMVELQGAIALGAVGLCLLLGKQFGWRKGLQRADALPLGQILREVWTFGFVQLAGLVSSNLAGWWATALVARGDTTLVQMTFFTIASQLRNLVSLPPSLLTEGSYAVMADPTHEATQTPQRVMALCCFAALTTSVLLGGLGSTLLPWGLSLIYGRSYQAAGAAVTLALATAVAHMGTAPLRARLTIVSIRATAVIDTIWAIFVAIAATLVLLHHGGAWRAMGIYFSAHVLSSFLMLLVLSRRDHLPKGLGLLFSFCALSMVVLSGLSLWRGLYGEAGAVTGVMALLLVGVAASLYGFGKRYGWLPPRSFFVGLLAKLPKPLQMGVGRV